MTTRVPGRGPRDADLMIVGEAPGANEVKKGRPFIGASGIELTKMLEETGFIRADAFLTNVCEVRPPENKFASWMKTKASGLLEIDGKYPNGTVCEGRARLRREVEEIKPKLILACGNAPLWALTGEWGITKWHGSIMRAFNGTKLMPLYHPAYILRSWKERYITVHNLRRARREFLFPEVREPEWSFIIRPDWTEICVVLGTLHASLEDGNVKHLACDIETRAGHISCFGMADSDTRAICIPFMTTENPYNYWTPNEEAMIIEKLRGILTHPNVRISGQNWIYDAQYVAKWWGFEVNLDIDTMIAHHTLFPGTPKGLDHLTRLYRDDFFCYWKDEGKNWDPRIHDQEQHWVYNCKDAVNTWAIAHDMPAHLESQGLTNQYEFQMRSWHAIFYAMLRGVRLDMDKKLEYLNVCFEEIAMRERWLDDVTGAPLNPRSPKQLQEFFYERLGEKPIINHKTHNPTTDEKALEALGYRDILYQPICQRINEVRSIGTSRAFCAHPVDRDKRIRCSYNVAGTETFRFNSSEDAFGFGTNLQNITKGDKDFERKRAEDPDCFAMPNLRKLFIPDRGKCIADFDLPQADAQVVAWEADDEELKAIFHDPNADLHDENRKVIYGNVTHFPGKPENKQPRHLTKQGVHLSNYGGSAYMLARTLGITQHEADHFQAIWFGRHPGIKKWQADIEAQLMSQRYVTNRFGFRRFYFDRIEGLLKEALAWIPQSTVAIATNAGIHEAVKIPGVELLLQTHDDAAYQIPIPRKHELIPQIIEASTVTVPYDDTLVFVPGCEESEVSWGDVKKYEAPLQEALCS